MQAAYNQYMTFACPVLGKVCADAWGDGKGLTYAQAAAVENLKIPDQWSSYLSGNSYDGSLLRGNPDAKSLDELQYFTGLTRLGTPWYVGDMYYIEHIIIPANVVTLEAHALRYLGRSTANGCTFVFLGTTPAAFTNTANFVFLGTKINEIRVPSESVALYKAASGWSDLADYIVAID